MVRALLNFGSDRKEAFATLQVAASDADPEIRKRAISASIERLRSSTCWLMSAWISRAPEPKRSLLST